MLKSLKRKGHLLFNRQEMRITKITKYVSAAATLSSQLKSYESIPGPKHWPLFGSMLSARELGGDYPLGNFPKFVDDLHRDYGDLVKWKRFNLREIYTFNPEHVKLLIAAEDNWPFRPIVWAWEIYARRHNFPSALVNSQGEFWKAQRSATNPIMAKPHRVLSYLPPQNAIVDEFIQLIKNEIIRENNNQSITITKFQNQIKYLNIELMGLVSFDRRLNVLNENRQVEYKKLVDDIEQYSALTGKLMYSIPIWYYWPTKTWKEFEACSHRIFSFIRKVAQEEYDKFNSRKESLKEIEDRSTMLQQFLANKKNYNLDMNIIVSVVSELLLAAFDTTSVNLHFLLYELARNPQVQDEVYQEIMKNYSAEGNSDLVTDETLSKIQLLKASLKESQRLHPMTPINTRVISKEIIFDNYLIPAGTQIHTCFETMSKSDKYFKDPMKFNPKRWTSEREDANKLMRFASMPFGFGARMCIGRRLAEQQIFTFVTKFLKNFKIEYVGKETKSKFYLVNAPDQDLDLKITKRI